MDTQPESQSQSQPQSQAPTEPMPGTFSSKLIQPISAQPAHAPPPPMYLPQNPYALYNPFGYAPVPLTYASLAVPPNPTYHHLLPYLDSLISQRRASNPHPHLPPTAPANLVSGYRNGAAIGEHFINTEGSYFCRTPSPASRQRTAQACVKCRERKTKCTGTSPCARCTARGLVCTYVAPRDKDHRGPARHRAELRDLPPIQQPSPFFRPAPHFLGVPGPASVPMLRGWEDDSEPGSCPSSATSSRFSVSSAGSSDSSLPPTPADDPAPLPSPCLSPLSLLEKPLPSPPFIAAQPSPHLMHPQPRAAGLFLPSPALSPVFLPSPAPSPALFLPSPVPSPVPTAELRTNEDYYRFLVAHLTAAAAAAAAASPEESPNCTSEDPEEVSVSSDASMVTVDLASDTDADASMASIPAPSSSWHGGGRNTDADATPRAPQHPNSLHLLLNPPVHVQAVTPSPSALLAEYLTDDVLTPASTGEDGETGMDVSESCGGFS